LPLITDLCIFYKGGLNIEFACGMPIPELFNLHSEAVRINKERTKK